MKAFMVMILKSRRPNSEIETNIKI